MKKIKVLHLASFSGNIGDIASHSGLYDLLPQKENISIIQMEIRSFYQNVKENEFDEAFCNYVNQFNLLIVGGGGFLAINCEKSKTATTFDIEEKMFDKIKIPVIFNSIGISEYVPASISMRQRFKKFMEYLLTKDNVLITTRNDGGIDILRGYCNQEKLKKIIPIYDCGFFAQVPDYFQPNIIKEKINVAINVAGDMLETRLSESLGLSWFISEIAKMLEKILDENDNVNIIFVPHILKDLELISQIVCHIPEKYKRNRVSTALCSCFGESALINFDLYRKCRCIIAMRNHAAIVPFGMGCNVVGLSTLNDFKNFFVTIGMRDNLVEIREKNCFEKLLKKIDFYINQNTDVRYQVMIKNEIELQRQKIVGIYKKYLG